MNNFFVLEFGMALVKSSLKDWEILSGDGFLPIYDKNFDPMGIGQADMLFVVFLIADVLT